jgi:hypothetical protein
VPAIVKLRRARRSVVRHRGGVFERAAVLQVRGDPRGAERVVADFGVDAGTGGSPADHTGWGKGFSVSRPPRFGMVRNSGPLGSSRKPKPSR